MLNTLGLQMFRMSCYTVTVVSSCICLLINTYSLSVTITTTTTEISVTNAVKHISLAVTFTRSLRWFYLFSLTPNMTQLYLLLEWLTSCHVIYALCLCFRNRPITQKPFIQNGGPIPVLRVKTFTVRTGKKIFVWFVLCKKSVAIFQLKVCFRNLRTSIIVDKPSDKYRLLALYPCQRPSRPQLPPDKEFNF